MIDEIGTQLDQLKHTINVESYDDLVACFKTNLSRFKFDMGGLIKSIDVDYYYHAGSTLRDLQTRVELLLKLSDFIDYVGVLQGSLKE